MADEEYCIIMKDVPYKSKYNFIGPLPHSLVLEKEDTPRAFNSVDEAVKAAGNFKKWRPDIKFEVRPYFGRSSYVYEIMAYGPFIIGKECLAKF